MSMGSILWPEVCGNETPHDAFWNPDISWNTQNPNLTKCLQDTLMVWVPCAFLWIGSLCYIPYLVHRKTVSKCRTKSMLNFIKGVLCFLLLLVSVIDLIKAIVDAANGHFTPLSVYLSPVCKILTFALALSFIILEFRKGLHTSGLLFAFWLFLLIAGIPTAKYRWEYSAVDSFATVTFYIYYGFVFIELILSLFADKTAIPWLRQSELTQEKKPLLQNSDEPATHETTRREPCPEASCSFLSMITYFWATKLLRKGWKRALVFEDLYDLMEDDKSKTLVPKFEKNWKAALEATEDQRPVDTGGEQNQVGSYAKIQTEGKKKTPSLIAVLLKTTGFPLVIGSFMRFITIILEFVNPQLLRLLIAYVSVTDTSSEDSTVYEWRGYLLVLALFANNVLHTVLQHWQQKLFYLTGQRLRGVVSTVVYRKMMRLSSASRRDVNVGNIVNLMSVDAQKLQDSAAYFHVIWTTPLMIGLSIYFLWQTIGPSCMAGLAVMIIVLPFNTFYIARKTSQLQKQQMKLKDSRVKAVNELLSGIKVLKLYAWEPSFQEKILEIREQELHKLAVANYINAVSSVSWFCLPYLVSLATFGTYVLLSPSNVLDADKAFVSLSLINLLNMPMVMLPMFLMFTIQAIVSIKRIQTMLLKPEVDSHAVTENLQMEEAVRIENGTFYWDASDEKPTLKNINIKVNDGSLVAVVGQVGSGKSSLISTMLAEIIKTNGSVEIKGSTAYIPQQAWIQNATLRDNIIFGKRYHKDTYNRIIQACALKPDLEILPGGDLIEIGEKGINLSGGQKQRVSLARSVYQDDDIYLFDDPLSAVDAHVGKHIFENLIGPNGLLKHKTRILVTHGVTYLPHVDWIIVLREGEISEQGTYADLLDQNGAFAEFLRTYLNEEEDNEYDEGDSETRETIKRQLSNLPPSESESESQLVDSSGSGRIRRRRQTLSRSKSIEKAEDKTEHKAPTKLIEEETAEIGAIRGSVIKDYISAGGWNMLFVVIFFHLAFIASQIFTSIWLSIWSSDKPINGTSDPALTDLRLGVYGALGAGQMLAILAVGIACTYGCVRASRILHKGLLSRILHATLSFFDTTPLGRIVNRFAKDMDIIDSSLPMFIRFLLFNIAPVVATIVVISYTTPIFLVVVVPLAVIYYFIQKVYIKTLRQLKRIDSIRRSPIYNHYDESLAGLTTIRAYRQDGRFIGKCDRLVDESQMAWYPILICQRWIGVTLEMLGNVIVLVASLLAVIQRTSVNGALVGLSINYALNVTMSLNLLLRATTEIETYIVAVERVQEYSNLPMEAPWEVEGNKPRLNWPEVGIIEYNDYSTRYRPGLDLVLKDVSCVMNSEEKVGIVGRTGAGKSSMTLSLFRIIEAAAGSIKIDDVNIGNIGLHDLRKRLTIIPQDPVLFSGTLRYNLDPFSIYGDNELWNVLEQAHLKHFVEGLSEGLSYECGEGGEALSVGQRQLVCLARALLRKSKILILDEATAAVDMETDDLIQTTIRNEFRQCTVLTIAHRLNTVMDYDRIIVMDGGRIKEFDTPLKLLKDKKTIFYSMARDAGLV